MANNTFDTLISAIHDAVEQAVDLATDQHIETINQFLEDDGALKTMVVKLTEDREIEVPLLALVPHNSIKISKVKVGFRVRFGALTDSGTGRKRNALSLDLGGLFGMRRDYAEIEVTFSGTDPPEGVARLNDEIIKYMP